MPWRVLLRQFLNRLADANRLSEAPLVRRAAQLSVYQWTKWSEAAGAFGRGGAAWLEDMGHGRLVRIGRNFAKNLQQEIKKIGRGGGGGGY